jgi:hypothetical protein
MAGVKGYTSLLKSLAGKMADQLANELQTYFAQNGWPANKHDES